MNIKIDVIENDHSVEAKVSGEIDVYTAPKVRETLFPISEREGITLRVDLTDVSYMDSTGLGVFVGIFKNIRAHNGTFQLRGLSDRLKRLFEITGLADIIDINCQNEVE
ncbi:anti-sigma factor antagonist [Bacillus sp. 31A1R]|uniref:Anti-sigma factor antagonist n=1 Tax=Robertmurraya mangrovi TaxID=3098077 RepID=A0ABU5J576_9BACI|nr:anti-sigma factor antagonist [Bacillus sp. 31A1R]MDZ5474575.1 anti-sigma factor antagonist [Bacillus sp. 31A1R]